LELGVNNPVTRQAEKKLITVDYNKYDVQFLFDQERTPENDYIFSALISFQEECCSNYCLRASPCHL
jgi:hypothetical protein